MTDPENVKFFIFYDSGGCNWGDHSTGVELCDTLELAKAWIKWHKEHNYMGDYTVIKGECVS